MVNPGGLATISTDGSAIHNGWENAVAGIGVWYRDGCTRNITLKLERPGENIASNSSVRTKDGGRLYRQYRYRAQLLCMKGNENQVGGGRNQVENSTNQLPRNLYSLYRECTISEEVRNA